MKNTITAEIISNKYLTGFFVFFCKKTKKVDNITSIKPMIITKYIK